MNPSIAELEHYLAVAAYLVVRHGEAYVPTMARLEQEIAAELRSEGPRAHAQRLLSERMRKGIKGAVAV